MSRIESPGQVGSWHRRYAPGPSFAPSAPDQEASKRDSHTQGPAPKPGIINSLLTLCPPPPMTTTTSSSSPLLIRPSLEGDIAAIQQIYEHAVLHGTGTF